MNKILASVLVVFLFINSNYAQFKVEDNTLLIIENYLMELEKIGLNCSVLIEINGEIKISRGLGFSDKEKQIKNSSNIIFDIGSITKQFTAAAILKLEMQEKLSINDKLSKYFDNVPKDKENISIHDLLRHQSGLVSNIGKDYEKISEEEFIIKTFTSPLKFETGKRFSYSNIGYSLLTLIIEKVSEQDYETFLYENLWKPSQMEMTGYSRPKFDENLIAVGYNMDGEYWGKPTDKEWDKNVPYLHLKGNGGILSTTEDLSKWNNSLLTENILSKEAKQKYFFPELRKDENNSNFYAYGWDVSRTRRNTIQIWHNGGNNIFYADFLSYLDENVLIIMLSNNFHPYVIELKKDISNLIFNNKSIPVIPAADNETNRNLLKKY